MQKMDLSGETLKPINYKAEMKMDLAAEREYMFDHVYKQQQKRFYQIASKESGTVSAFCFYRQYHLLVRQSSKAALHSTLFMKSTLLKLRPPNSIFSGVGRECSSFQIN